MVLPLHYFSIRRIALGMFCLGTMQVAWSQAKVQVPLSSSTPANFGVDGDLKSGTISFNTDDIPETDTDDWFFGTTGRGVIDTSDQATINNLAAGMNIMAEFRMSQPINSTIDGNLWLDAVYLRDQYSNNNEKDATIFGGGDDKNFDDPTTWVIKKGSVPPKNDIIDIYAHLRRDYSQPDSSNQWVYGAVSTRSQNGDNYLDFEYFRKPISYEIPSNSNAQGTLSSEGMECGHTAYRFDTSNGDILTNGDIILSVNYINGGALADFRFFAWIDINDIKRLDGDASTLSDADFLAYNDFENRRFDFGDGSNFEFYPCNNDSSSSYGYARISLRSDVSNNPIFAQDNSGGPVAAPSWGTIGPDGNLSSVYEPPTFIEFALNTTLLGLDTSLSNGICGKPLGTVLVKTRASSSFTSELKDLAGPFVLGNWPEYTVSISEPYVLTCSVSEITLTATTSVAGDFTYEWFKDGQPIDDSTPGNYELTVTEPGHYSVNVNIANSCTAQSDSVEVLQNIIEPSATASGGVIDCATGQTQINATMSSTNPNAHLTFEWTGPNGFVNTTELNPIVSAAGIYVFTITDNNNGCNSSANAEVTSEAETTLEIQCPPDIEVQCKGDIPVPDPTKVTIINLGENGQPIVRFVNDVSNNGGCPEIITRTFSATDDCGNVVYCTQLITVNDTENPNIADLADYTLTGCNAEWPSFLTTTWTDNCSSGGSIDSDGGVDDGESADGCTQYRLYTFTVTDGCGNTDTETTRVGREYDMTNPSIVDIADYTLTGCNTEWPAFLTTTWMDNCSSGGSIDSDGGVDDGESADGCTQYRLYTFTITDACGNTDTETTRVGRTYDMTNPEIVDLADYALSDCNADWPLFLTTTWMDNCSSGGSIDSDGGVDDGESADGCIQYRLYTFTITDACGNTDTETTRVGRTYDMTNPEIVDLADYALSGCNADWPLFLTTTWTDNCSSGGSIDSDGGMDDGESADGCTQYRLYTFTVTDGCGNTNTETTRITREFDITNPDIVDIPDYNLDANSTVWPPYLTTTWTDNCSVGGGLNSDAGVDDGTSIDGKIIYRLYTFTVSDACGNVDTETTRVGMGSGQGEGAGPEIADIPDFTLSGCNIEWPFYLTTTWTSNCPGGGSIVSDGGVDDGESADGCVQYRLYMFIVTDGCGNTSTETTRVSREYDMTNPEIVDLEDYALSGCNAEWPPFLTTTWTDNCSAGGSIDSDGGVENGESADGCTQYRLYTFTVTDACSNTATETTRVSRTFDMTNPEIVDLEDYSLSGCNSEWPPFLTTTWTDNCSAGGSIDSDGGVENGESSDGCVQYRLYTFTVTDACNNTATETTRISRAYDMTNPEIVDLEDYALSGCNAEWPPFLTTTWTDNCSAGGSIDSDGGVDDGESTDGCTQYRLYTFTVTDACGNTDTETTRVGREYDMTNPDIVDIADYELTGCNAEWPAFLTTTWTDNCSTGGSIDSDEGMDDGISSDGATEYRLYAFTVTDACGNSSTENTRLSRTIGSGTSIEQGLFEDICRKDFPAPDGYDLTVLLPDNTPSGGVWSLFSSPDNSNVPFSQDGSVVTTELLPGTYTFRYTLGNECNQIIEVGINVLPPDQEPCVLAVCPYGVISTAMTPNGDHVNDTFDAGLVPGGGCTVDVQIFNRWGNKIFEAQDYNNDWAGAVQTNALGSAKKITTGTYYYILQYKVDGKVEQTVRGYFYVATE